MSLILTTPYCDLNTVPHSLKIIVIILLIAFFPRLIRGQQWAPEGATWHYESGWMMWGVGFVVDASVNDCVGDTLVNDTLCRKITNGGGCEDYHAFAWESPYLLTFEDSGKIYFYDFLDQIFKLVWDMNAEVGDSWIIHHRMDPSTESIYSQTFLVDSVSTLVINGEELRRVSVSANGYYAGYFTEILGYSNAIVPGFPICCCDAGYTTSLRCYEDEILGSVSFVEYQCDASFIETPVSENATQQPSIYPNPVTDFFTILFSSFNPGDEIEVVDAMGQVVYKENIFSNEMKLDASRWAPGLYEIYCLGHHARLIRL